MEQTFTLRRHDERGWRAETDCRFCRYTIDSGYYDSMNGAVTEARFRIAMHEERHARDAHANALMRDTLGGEHT